MDRSIRRTEGRAGMTGGPSFKEVFQEGFPYVRHVLRRLGVPKRDRDDRAQDVFLAAYQSLPTYDAARPLRPWLHGVAFRVVSNDRRLARNRNEVIVDDVVELADPARSPEEAAAETMDRELLIQLMQGLDL